MGKSKDDDKRKRSSPSSRGGEGEGRPKRRKSKEDDTKSKSKKSHRSHKTSKRRSDRDKKSSVKIKDKGRNHSTSGLNFQELSNDDYFSKNNEFSTWLKQERNLFFSDLSSGSARDLFSEFVKVWNKQELDEQYYDGIATAPRTSHQWKIKK